jgi:hypothetical protein
VLNVQTAGEFVPCQDTEPFMSVDVCLEPKPLSYHTTDLATNKFFPHKTQEGVKWKETLPKSFSSTVTRHNCPVLNNKLHESLRTVARSLGSLHKFPTAFLQAEYNEQNNTAYKLMLQSQTPLMR